MEDPGLNSKVSKMLKEFDSIDDIEPSAGWNQSLMNRLSASKSYSAPIFPTAGFTVVVLLFVLINLGYALNAIISGPNGVSHRDKELMVISKELLINPISINN